ncbi:MAG: phosphatase PAP2 family protein [Candidatus Helarchaeota archaeon]|nr:phosphatase PAP2 family protein [Candidatus Helarchaeota archaeon]
MDWAKRIGILALVLITIIFLATMLIIGTGNLILGDEQLFMALNPDHPTPFDEFFKFFSTWGPGKFGLGIYLYLGFALTLLFLSLKYSTLQPMRFMLLLIIVSFIVGYLGIYLSLNFIIGRDRPFMNPVLLSNANYLFTDPAEIFYGASFPSGHATTGFIFATPFVLLFKKYWIRLSAIIYGILMGYARIYLGGHFPLDVLVGSLVGILSVWVCYIIFKKYVVPRVPWFQYIEPEKMIEESDKYEEELEDKL